jgi:hypothetical protein
MKFDPVVALITLYMVGGFGWLVVWVGTWLDDRNFQTKHVYVQRSARLLLCFPLWPLIIGYWIARGFKLVLRDAFTESRKLP